MNDKQRALDFVEIEWGTYLERFNRLPADTANARVKEKGFERFRDILAHVLAWWREGMEVITAITENREYARKKYDMDAFNAAAITEYQDWDETEFANHFEKTRQKILTDLKAVRAETFENQRVRNWVNGIFIEHARDHLVALSRFLTLDTLQNGWATYIEDFEKIDNKDAFLKNQGVESLHDLLAHHIGWWEECARIVTGILADPSFTTQDHAADAFNTELIKKYAQVSEADIRQSYEATRLAMIEMVNAMPDDAFLNNTIERWLAADLVEHYDEHNPQK